MKVRLIKEIPGIGKPVGEVVELPDAQAERLVKIDAAQDPKKPWEDPSVVSKLEPAEIQRMYNARGKEIEQLAAELEELGDVPAKLKGAEKKLVAAAKRVAELEKERDGLKADIQKLKNATAK